MNKADQRQLRTPRKHVMTDRGMEFKVDMLHQAFKKSCCMWQHQLVKLEGSFAQRDPELWRSECEMFR